MLPLTGIVKENMSRLPKRLAEATADGVVNYCPRKKKKKKKKKKRAGLFTRGW